jgi:hypothetical protein
VQHQQASFRCMHQAHAVAASHFAVSATAVSLHHCAVYQLTMQHLGGLGIQIATTSRRSTTSSRADKASAADREVAVQGFSCHNATCRIHSIQVFVQLLFNLETEAAASSKHCRHVPDPLFLVGWPVVVHCRIVDSAMWTPDALCTWLVWVSVSTCPFLQLAGQHKKRQAQGVAAGTASSDP